MRPIYRIKSFGLTKYLFYISGGVQGREHPGDQGTGDSKKREQKLKTQPLESTVFLLPFNVHPERKFPIRFFITSKVMDKKNLTYLTVS